MAARGVVRAPKALLGRFTATTPITLFRVQDGTAVKLRPEAAARAAGRRSFDISKRDGLVWPRDAAEPNFLGPNGMSMRPMGTTLSVIVGTFKSRNPMVFEVPQGAPLPHELLLLHEHSDHYALQPSQSMKLAELNAVLSRFLAQPLVRRYASLEAFYEAYPDTHPSVVGFSENA
jgi:hypothetical protein